MHTDIEPAISEGGFSPTRGLRARLNGLWRGINVLGLLLDRLFDAPNFASTDTAGGAKVVRE